MRRLREGLRERDIESTSDLSIVGSVVLLPTLAVALVTYNFAVASTPDLLPLWAAIPLGVGLGTGVFVLHFWTTGRDMLDVIATSVVVILVMLLSLPLAPRVKADRLRRRQQVAPVRMPNAPPTGRPVCSLLDRKAPAL